MYVASAVPAQLVLTIQQSIPCWGEMSFFAGNTSHYFGAMNFSACNGYVQFFLRIDCDKVTCTGKSESPGGFHRRKYLCKLNRTSMNIADFRTSGQFCYYGSAMVTATSSYPKRLI